MTAAALRPPRAAEAPALAAALAAGSGFHAAGLPLAFVIGPLLACAAFAVAGRPVYAPIAGRKAGQLVIGTTIGLKVTPGTVVMAATWVPLMLNERAERRPGRPLGHARRLRRNFRVSRQPALNFVTGAAIPVDGGHLSQR